MKFIVDENLPPSLSVLFRAYGLTAHHVNEMKARQKQQVKDDQLRRLTIQKGYIIVTKDDDFVKSFVSRKVPDKVVFIYGMSNKELLLSRMKEVIPDLRDQLLQHDFIEINEKEVRFPFTN